ncbi:TetR/AcrR family transcriptional regulator [Nocardia sp. NPDC056611]|uniref:TetR/AcrR family transcriptional regulator n=1 Tax=Nocardia sp. NPDC056611 TaxID=3345877 RepID=UPI00366FAAF8
MNDVDAAAPTRMDRRRARTRERILDEAERLFAGGYRTARMEELAEAADVSVGTIYTHFGNKDGLMLALVERATRIFNVYLDEAFELDASPLERVMAVADLYAKFFLTHRESFRFLVQGVEAEDNDNDMRQRASDEIDRLMARFETGISAAIDAGEADDYPAANTARFLWGAWNGVIALSMRNDSLALTDDQMIECLDVGRRLVNEGLTSPHFRDATGHSRARLIEPPEPERRTKSVPR